MSPASALLPDDPIDDDTIFGVIIGLVTQATGDPMNLNRVMVNFPTLGVDSAWARVASFFAGPTRGAFFMPAVDDEVLVAFEAGDVSRPYIIGRLWNGKDLPPVNPEQVQTVGQIQTSSGAYLQFDDTNGGTSITVTDKAGNQIVINTQTNSITLTSMGDITVSAPQGKLSLTAGTVEISATEGNLTMSANSAVSLMANGDIGVFGAMIRLN